LENISTTNDDSLKLLTISEVAPLIRRKKGKATQNWLKSKGITPVMITNRTYVYKINVDMALYYPLIKGIYKSNPNNWESLCRGILKNESLFQLLKNQLESETHILPKTKVVPRDESDNELLKRFR
jgi:hypothetical protein